MRFCAARNVALYAVASDEFNDYAEYISKQMHHAPSRYHLMLALADMCNRLDTQKAAVLDKYNFMGFEANSWTKAGRHIMALTAGNPGTSFYLSSYENLGADPAVTDADAIQQCMLSALGLPTDLSPNDSKYQRHKVAVFTSDTTNVIPATCKALRKFGMYECCVWMPGFPHVGNLGLLDQLKIPAFAKLLSHAKQIVTVFRVGAFRKIFLTCVPDHICLFFVVHPCARMFVSASGRPLEMHPHLKPTYDCSFSESPIGQLQLWCKTRFSFFSELVHSLQRHRETLQSAVRSAAYATAASKTQRRATHAESEGELPHDPQAADRELEDMETGLFNTRAVPHALIGSKKYAIIHQIVTSSRFFEALAVRN